MTRQELQQEKLISKMHLTNEQLLLLDDVLELERELTLLETN